MAIRNDHDDYGWALPRERPRQTGLHDYDEPTPSLRDTMIELATTLFGIAGVFFLLIALVKAFA